MMRNVVQAKKEHAGNSAGADTVTPSGSDETSNSPISSSWHEIAERRLARLVEAEHDASVSRGRLELLQFEYRELLVLSAARLQCLNERERELANILASRSWRRTAALRVLAARLRSAKAGIRRIVRKSVKAPFLRPIIRASVRLLPGLSARLHAKLHAQHH